MVKVDRCKLSEDPHLDHDTTTGGTDLVGVSEISKLKADAKLAFFDEDFNKSLSLFTKAIGSRPTAELYSDRAKVHLQLMNYVDAVIDCNMALQLDSKCCKAYLRKGIAYMKEKRYYSAKEVLKTCLRLGYNDSTTCSELINECDECIKGDITETEYNEREQKKMGTANRLFIIYDERMYQHRPSSKKDKERPNRIRGIIAKLQQKDLLKRCGVSAEANPVEREYALAVHDEEYIKFIEMLPLKAKDLKAYYKYLPDNPEGRQEFVASPGTPQAVFLAAGAVVEACRQVAIGNYQFSFAIVRPPGHHARSSGAGGFCFFNNIAIGARYLQREHNMKRILVIDFDVHHGDGTQEIFYSDDSVLFCSVHRSELFPEGDDKGHDFIGEGKGKGYTVNINLEQPLKNGDLLAVFDYVFLPLAKEFNPDFVLISAGFDAAVGDRVGKSFVTPHCFGELICRAKTISHGNLVLALEGGYCIESLAESCVECVKELLDGNTQIAKCKYEDANSSTWESIAEVSLALQQYWPHLKAPHEDPPDP